MLSTLPAVWLKADVGKITSVSQRSLYKFPVKDVPAFSFVETLLYTCKHQKDIFKKFFISILKFFGTTFFRE